MGNFLFTSESVAIGHPDKIADQISDAIVDACIKEDPLSRVASETLVTTGLVVMAGEITTKASVNYQEIVRKTIHNIGYDDSSIGFDYRSCGVLFAIDKQSPDIAGAIHEDKNEMGAGDQGLMFGYACDDTPQLMPLPIMLSHTIVRELYKVRLTNEIPYLRPDGKTQVTIEYDENHVPLRIHTVVLSVQHAPDVDNDTIRQDMKQLIHQVAPKGLITDNTLFYINPSGRFIVGGPHADCGMTGRKTIVDTYGGMARHGGGAFSGKDPTKVDRSASYAARYIAKNIVAAKLASRCEIQISYSIGLPFPTSIKVDTFGTSKVGEPELVEAIRKVFDLSPKGIINMLNLRRPIYTKTAFGGHFGREEAEFTWEKTNKVNDLISAL